MTKFHQFAFECGELEQFKDLRQEKFEIEDNKPSRKKIGRKKNRKTTEEQILTCLN